jgi:ubiquinone/menaquinone biosynthesis C-methylase UbiE
MSPAAFENNSEAIEAWNTVLFDKFVRFRRLLTTGLGAHGDALLASHPIREGQRVLDVGCGFGDTTIQIARLTGPRGGAVGVDAAARFIESARRDAEAAGLKNATFEVRDVEVDVLGGPYDRAFARFGTQFFANPVAALRNVRKSLASGALFTFVAWRKKDDNPWLHVAEQRVLEIVPHVDNEDEPTCGPGPFSMASADLVSAQILAAGFRRPTFERFDCEVLIGRDLAEAIEFALALGPAGEILRLAGAAAEGKMPEVRAALEDALRPFVSADGVRARSSSWLMTAEAP